MPYGVCTYENVNIGAASVQSALDVLKDDEDKQHVLDNLETWDCVLGNGMFDITKYSSICCKMDCKVLMEGYGVFRVSGAIQQFISKCVVGGRVMTNPNKQYHVKRK